MRVYNKRIHGSIHVLVVDDEELLTDLFQDAIRGFGYECSVANNGFEALSKLQEQRADVVVTDIQMPGMDGLELVKHIKAQYDTDIIVMSGHRDFEYTQIIAAGAQDFFRKPISISELAVRLERVINERTLREERNQAYSDLQKAYIDTVNRLVLATEYKDQDTGGHIFRMSQYSALLAAKLGLSDEDIEIIQYSAPMHDVGKIGIPDSILLKPGKLTNEEFEVMKTHTTIGASILANSDSRILRYAQNIALSHHERWNGSGYPHGLAGGEIPLAGRVVSLADVFDALTSTRPYKVAFPVKKAVDIIVKERGQHFDPDVVDIFLDNLEEILHIKNSVSSIHDNFLAALTWDKNSYRNGNRPQWGEHRINFKGNGMMAANGFCVNT